MKVVIAFLTLFMISSVLYAQNMKVVKDFRTRTAIGVEKEISDHFIAFGELTMGLEENSSKLGKFFGETGISYLPVKMLEFSAKYRFTRNRKNYSDEYKNTHLLAIAGEAKYKIDPLKLYWRIQYQNVDEELFWSDSNQKTSHVLKNRLKIKYNIWGIKLKPYMSAELYLESGVAGIDASKMKSILGLEYPLHHRRELKVYYRNDRELTGYVPYTYHMIGASYYFNFKN